jgi:hypothetical protein
MPTVAEPDTTDESVSVRSAPPSGFTESLSASETGDRSKPPTGFSEVHDASAPPPGFTEDVGAQQNVDQALAGAPKPQVNMQPVAVTSGRPVGSPAAVAPAPGTELEHFGALVPQAAVPALQSIQTHVNEPLNKAAQAGAEFGKEVGQEAVTGATILSHPAESLSAALSSPYGPKPATETPEQTAQREHPVAMVIASGVGEAAGGAAADPRNWPFFASGGARPVLQKIISLGFSGMMAKDATDAAVDLHANWDKYTPQQRAEIAAKGGISGVMAAMGAYHAATSKLPPPAPLRPEPESLTALHNEARDIVNSAGLEYPYNPTPEDLKTSYRQFQARAANAAEADQPAMKEKANRLQEIYDKLSKGAPTEKPVHHTSNDVKALRESAEAQSGKIGDAVAKAAEPVEGAKVEAVRDAKDSDRIEDKAKRQNVQPSQIGDIAGAKVSVPDQEAANEVLKNLHQEMPVESANGTVTGEPQNNAVRQTQAIVDTEAPPEEPIKHAEIMLQTPEMHAATDRTHDQYREAQELRAQGKEAEAQAIESEIAKTHEAAEQAARSRQGESDALSQRGPATVHGGAQKENGASGREPERVGAGNGLQETPTPSAQAAEKEKLPDHLGDKRVQVKDAKTGEWKDGTVIADVMRSGPTTRGEATLRKLRGQFDDGGRFDVGPESIRLPQSKRVGVDFDGTLVKENADGSIGEPIPERIASLKQRIAAGDDVIIESHRAKDPQQIANIQEVLISQGLPRLPVTAKKTAAGELIDDKQGKTPGVDVDRVATNANAPLPDKPFALSEHEKELSKPYGPPKADFGGRVPDESLGLNPNPAEDFGNKARAEVERRMGGALPRGATERRVEPQTDDEKLKAAFAGSRSVGNKEGGLFTQAKSELFPGKRELSNDEIAKVETRARELSSQKTATSEKTSQPVGGSDAGKERGSPAKETRKEVAPGKVGEMKVSDLRVAPNKFQYKLGTDAAGTSTLLKEARAFNPDLAGTISVWKDPSDGKTYVVNGHHRYELAVRKGQDEIAVRHVVADDAETARAIGAMQNIAEGRGTAVDAAKFLRDSGMTLADFQAKGISLGEATAAKGLALANLDDSLFNKVVQGDLREGRAVAIGEATKDPAEQKAILSLVEKKESRGTRVSDDTLSELIRLVKGSEQTTETTQNLFGTQEISRSLALEKAEISAHIKQQLAKDKKLFGFVAKADRATELERGGNKIDVGKSKEISTGAAQAEEVYNKLSERGGPIASILDESARKLAEGDSPATVKSEAYTRVRSEISKTLGPPEGTSAGRSEEAREENLEPTLPGMEHVPTERAEANAEHQGKELTEKLTEPPKSIEAKAGEIEQKSPLFRDTEANPQKGLFGSDLLSGESGSFEPGKVGEAAKAVGDYIGGVRHSTEIARDLQRSLETLDTQKQADILEGINVMKVMKSAGLKHADDEAIYHHLEDPNAKLSDDQQKWLDDIVTPLQKMNTEFYEELKKGGVPIENYVHRVVQGKGGVLDRIAQGAKAMGSRATLSKSAPQTKQRTYMALDNDKGERQVVSIKNGQVTAWKDGTPENLGGLSASEEGKQFEDKDGQTWKLKQATTKEIEANTDTKYYHSAIASTVVSNIQLGSAVRALRFLEEYKKSPEFKESAVPQSSGNPPKGWRTTNLPQFTGYYFEPRTAEVLDQYYDRMRQGNIGALDKVGALMRATMLLNPIMHPMNVAASWAMEKGATGLFMTPFNRATWRAGNKAVKAVLSKNDDFLAALDAGAAVQSHRAIIQDITRLFFNQLSEALDKKETWATKIADATGLRGTNVITAYPRLVHQIAFSAGDIFYLQSAYQYQMEHPGVSLEDALKESGRINPEYRIPTRIADVPQLSKLMTNRWATIFGPYHYSLLKSFGEVAKSALGAQEPAPGRTKAQEVSKGWDRLAALGIITMMLYPALDELAKHFTGDKHAKVRRAGPFGLIDSALQVASKQQSVSTAAQRVVTPAPQTKAAAELAFNRDFYSGHQIYDPHADWKTEGHQIGRYLLDETLGQPGQFAKAETSEQKHRFALQQIGITMAKTPAEKVAADIAMSKVGTEAEDPEDHENRVERREILNQLRKGNRQPLQDAIDKHEITGKQAHALERRSRLTPLQDTVHGFSYKEAKKVYDVADADEKKELETILAQKERRAHMNYWQ